MKERLASLLQRSSMMIEVSGISDRSGPEYAVTHSRVLDRFAFRLEDLEKQVAFKTLIEDPQLVLLASQGRYVVLHAYRLVRANQGSPGIDGVSFSAIESREGVEEGACFEMKNIGKPCTSGAESF